MGAPPGAVPASLRDVILAPAVADSPEVPEPGQRGQPVVIDGALETDAEWSATAAVNRLLLEALEARATDVHLESHQGELRVRFRVDGILQDVPAPRPVLRPAILARLRVMGGLNLAEHRLPQDGRMRVVHRGANVDLRISTVPTLGGVSVALRVLDSRRQGIVLEELGLEPHDLSRLLRVILRPHGMLLATGPGGAGKSTTLHAMVKRISSGKEKILTVEDPVEYAVEGVCQVPVNHRAGLTFATTLRSLVRQDPDVLLVGEIRDAETAEIATHAALTGHLVLSTLHTTDAVTALPRMLDLGVPEYMVAHTVEAVLAQRLVRHVCDHCAAEVQLSDDETDELGPDAQGLTSYMRGSGCDACRGTGYRDRTGLFELLVTTEELRDAFLRRSGTRGLREIAIREGMRTMRQDGIAKIRAGVTTPEEVVRVT